jgi:hypothetical protein
MWNWNWNPNQNQSNYLFRLELEVLHKSKEMTPTLVRSELLKTRGVSHCELAIYIKKYLKAKEEL